MATDGEGHVVESWLAVKQGKIGAQHLALLLA